MNCDTFMRWYNNARAGDKCTYYEGMICTPNTAQELELKDLTWKYAVEGRIYLYQIKIANGVYTYFAEKATHTIPKLNPSDYLLSNYAGFVTREKYKAASGWYRANREEKANG